MQQLTAIDFINVGKSGTFAESGNFKTSPQQVDEIFGYLQEKDIEQLVVYFHGGLVSEKSGMESAGKMTENFKNPGEKRHVVSFVWETGPKEVILQNIDTIKKKVATEFYQEALNFVIKLVAKRLGVTLTKGGGGTDLTLKEIEEEKKNPYPFDNMDVLLNFKGGGSPLEAAIENESNFMAKLEIESNLLIKREGSANLKNKTKADDPDLTNELNPVAVESFKGMGMLQIAKIVAKIAYKVLKRYVNQTHHDFYPTIMEETFRTLYVGGVGTWGWSSIKTKAQAMFEDNAGLSGDNLHAGTYFMQALEQHYLSRKNANKKFKVYLIGHSAGSIVICFLLKTAMKKFPGLKFETVFFLAPACRTDLFLSHCKPAKEAGLFNSFKLFTMKTEYEKKDQCIPYVYTRSLLYMVSGLFEVDSDNNALIDAKIMGLNEQFEATGRYASFKELTELNAFLDGCPVVLSEDKVNPDLSMRSSALKHGDFDNDDLTLASILKSL